MTLKELHQKIPAVYRAAIAILGVVAAEQAVVVAWSDAHLPHPWVNAIVAGFTGAAGLLAFLARNKGSVDFIEKVIREYLDDETPNRGPAAVIEEVAEQNPDLVQQLIDKYKASH